ncbi:hypothetical protein N7281_07775 [Rickettsia hoogstraalii]|uniref:hypothetical protein n=1 Tax=Rickettsia hoogstraalii TaxID=467174 RepID=UPI00225AC59C|nr:hypothetical protein [Rickettsia hoogstraalii]MCX4084697.1 hypothetical protein [Rickettsia hoogstraalii]
MMLFLILLNCQYLNDLCYTIQEIKELRELVENDKVKLSSNDKTETLELIAQYEQAYPDLIRLMGEEDDII